MNWIDVYKLGNFSHILTYKTHAALTHTIYGMIEVTKLCFEELNLKYVLYGKFQTDSLKHRRGK